MSWKRRSAGSPPTLWWVLIFWAAFVSDVGALDDVGVERALGQEVDGADPRRLFLEDADELVADDLALLLGILDAGQPGDEPLPRIDHDEIHAEIALERDPQQLRFLLAHEPVVDVDAGQPIADRPMDERRRDGRVDPARQGADHLAVRTGRGGVGVDALADAGHGRVDEVGGGPVRLDAGDALDEVAQDVATARRMDHLGVELDAVQVPGRGLEPGERGRIGLGGRHEALGQAGDRIAVAHPDRLVPMDPREQPVVGRQLDVGRAVLALAGGHDIPAELVGHELRAVADPEHRDPAAPDGRIGLRGAVVVDRVRGRPTG